MNSSFFSCTNPQRIFNRNTKSFEYVPCGKCKSCINRNANIWSDRVGRECEQHAYSYFFTLTYDNEHVPYIYQTTTKKGSITFRPSDRLNSLLTNNHRSFPYAPFVESLYSTPHRTFENFDGVLPQLTRSNGKIGVLCKQEVINFVKRLRINIKRYFHEDIRIRFFIAGEYGERTMRPHYHGIIWFDDRRLVKKILYLIRKSWAIYRRVRGHRNRFEVDRFCSFARFTESGKHPTCGLIRKDGYKYVAEYVSGNTFLPDVLLLKQFKPFHLSSKAPSIGYYKDATKEMFENIKRYFYKSPISFDARDVVERTFTKLQGEQMVSCSVPYPSDIASALWCKCYEYRQIPHSTKLKLYSFLYRHRRIYEDPNNEINSITAFRDIFPIEYDSLRLDKPQNRVATKKCYDFCKKYCVTPYEYVEVFDFWLHQKERYKLCQFYELQERLIMQYGDVKCVAQGYPFAFELPDYVPQHVATSMRAKYPNGVYKNHLMQFWSNFGYNFYTLYPDGYKLNKDKLLSLRYENSQEYLIDVKRADDVNWLHNKLRKVNNGLPDNVEQL